MKSLEPIRGNLRIAEEKTTKNNCGDFYLLHEGGGKRNST